ncbi:MAG TPA: alpha/beta hydrolase [Bacillales bacterium]|nr:alpha/beta hydrolase [Bacillales bacterium]
MKVNRLYYGENENQFGDLRLPGCEGPYPVAIVIHGGFWRAKFGLDIMDRFCEALTNGGLATWNIEYRRVGQEGGGWPGTFKDAAKAADFLYKIGPANTLDLDRVVSIGHSAGGHLALWLGGRHRLSELSSLRSGKSFPLKGAVSLAGVNDLALMQEVHHIPEVRYGEHNNPVRDLLGSPDECLDRYDQASPIRLLPLGIPQVLIHGSLDIHVPVGLSHHYHNEAVRAGENVKLVELPVAEHFKLIDPESETWPIILEETLGLLK